MSDFLKLAYELIAQIIYNLASWIVAIVSGFIKVFITGWYEYGVIFMTYFRNFNILLKLMAILLALLLISIPVLLLVILVRHCIVQIRLKADQEDNATLYKEIGRLNRQVMSLMDEKNKILALKVGATGAGYMGGDALLANDGSVAVAANGNGGGLDQEALTGAATVAAVAASEAVDANRAAKAAAASGKNAEGNVVRFPKLTRVDEAYRNYVRPDFNDDITLEEFVEQYRLYAASQAHLYYTPEIVRRFVAGMAASKLLILEGISGTGKTSLPHSFSRYMNNPATMISVQPSYRDRTELLGYFNEFSKRFNETEFLRSIYEAGYREDPTLVILDEMNLARIEYYFAEMLSILEMPSKDEWVLDLVPTAWPGDPEKLFGGKIHVPDTMWFVGTANNDDSTFTITDKVYDRAMPIELNERAAAFECPPTPQCLVSCEHLQEMFAKAKQDYAISDATLDKMDKLNNYLITRFNLSFGNRIIKQMHDFIPVYVACGGTELGGMDYIIARKVLKKFESMNVSFVRDEIKGLITYIEKVFGKTAMPDSKAYLTRIQNLY